MLLSKKQATTFWKQWSSVKTQLRHEGFTDAQIEAERHAMLLRSGFTSLTLVDRTAGFDRVLGELGRMQDNVARTVETLPAKTLTIHAGPKALRQVPNTPGERRRVLWKIEQLSKPLGGKPYVLAVARDKFHITEGVTVIENLSIEQLHQLKMTLARAATRKLAAGHAASLDSEEEFQDQVEFPPDAEDPETTPFASDPEPSAPAIPATVLVPAIDSDSDSNPF